MFAISFHQDVHLNSSELREIIQDDCRRSVQKNHKHEVKYKSDTKNSGLASPDMDSFLSLPLCERLATQLAAQLSVVLAFHSRGKEGKLPNWLSSPDRRNHAVLVHSLNYLLRNLKPEPRRNFEGSILGCIN